MTGDELERNVNEAGVDERAAVWQQVHEALAAFKGPDGFESPNRVVVVAGTAPSPPIFS